MESPGLADMIDCLNQPGGLRLTAGGCARQYLAAQIHPQVIAHRKRGKQGVPPALMGTPLAGCLYCKIGESNAEREVQKTQEVYLLVEETPLPEALLYPGQVEG